MKLPPGHSHGNLPNRCRVLRALVSVVLLASLGIEILPFGFVECAPVVSGAQQQRTVSIEPLQVCDHGDTFLGVLFDLPVLLPGGLCLHPSSERLPLVRSAAVCIPDGFAPSIDRPPRRSA